MEDHMTTSADNQSQDEHMITERQMEKKLLLPNTTDEKGNKKGSYIGTVLEEGLLHHHTSVCSFFFFLKQKHKIRQVLSSCYHTNYFQHTDT